jgi:hypothetical protein
LSIFPFLACTQKLEKDKIPQFYNFTKQNITHKKLHTPNPIM